MKIVLVMDDNLYRSLVQNFPYYDEDGRIIGSYFSDQEYDNYHLRDKDYINIFINPYGIKDIDTIIIQKSMYDDITCVNIALFFQRFRPETRVVFLLDDSLHRYFCHVISTNHIGYLCRIDRESASPYYELNDLFDRQFNIDQTTDYALPGNIKGRELKRLKAEYEMRFSE